MLVVTVDHRLGRLARLECQNAKMTTFPGQTL